METLVDKAPLCSAQFGPRDAEWPKRLAEELSCLIKFISACKASGFDWIRIHPDDGSNGVSWSGQCSWFDSAAQKTYTFAVKFEIPAGYPLVPPEIQIPELDGKTDKMYRGGRICLTDHFYPLWNRNAVKFGIAHALALGLAPWLSVEIPNLVAQKKI